MERLTVFGFLRLKNMKIDCPVYGFVKENLSGNGLEIGASFHAIPVNEKCNMIYVDKYTRAEIIKGLEGQTDPGIDRSKIAETIIINDLCDLRPLTDNYFDFTCHSHVGEHTVNFIKAIKECLRVTKPTGYLYFIIPDKRFTFDRDRKATEVEHLIWDYKKNVTQIEMSHYQDYCMKVAHAPKTPQELFDVQGDIHIHTFTEFTVKQLLECVDKELGFEILDIKFEDPFNIAVLLQKGI